MQSSNDGEELEQQTKHEVQVAAPFEDLNEDFQKCFINNQNDRAEEEDTEKDIEGETGLSTDIPKTELVDNYDVGDDSNIQSGATERGQKVSGHISASI